MSPAVIVERLWITSYDVTQGDNLHYAATDGWDYAMGLGTPNLPDFYKTLLAMAKQS